ncbi:MAG: hypothetical protein IJW19_06375 [Clostridia bacterium]|nr:hypothetical protein [Clostridia bacterium]
MKKNKCAKIYMAEDMAKKLSVVAKGEGMTVSSLLTFLARQKISYYERVKGNIKPADMVNADLSEFETVE